MAFEIVSYVWKRFSSLIFVQDTHKKVMHAAGVSKEVENIAKNFKTILAVLPDAQAKEMKETGVRDWLNKVKDISYDMDDAFDEYITSFLRLQNVGVENSLVNKKVCYFFLAPHFFSRAVALCRQIAIIIKDIDQKLDAIVQEKELKLNVRESIEKQRQITSSVVGLNEIVGLNEEKNILVSKLLFKSSKEQEGLSIISIIGMGGIGKTTLAQLAYNDDQIIKNFDIRIWVCVSDPFDEFKIAKVIIEALGDCTSNLVEFNSLIQKLHDKIKDKKFLIVLDDVWTEDYNEWEPFYHCLKNGLNGRKILITTRKEPVACMMRSNDIININGLSNEENWFLFKQLAFFGSTSEECKNLEKLGKEIVKKCKGLPLAIKTIGSLLRSKRTIEGWKHILDNEIWELEEFEKDFLPILLLSYNDLPYMIRLCFSYCAIFPKDYKIEKNTLIQLWMAQGYLGLEQNIEMEIIGERYFNHLAKRSFFQEFEKDNDGNIIFCKMHDIMHDFAQFIRKNECFNVEVLNVEEPLINSSHKKILHAMLTLNQGAPFPISICNSVKKLRSLLIYHRGYEFNSLDSSILSMLFGESTCLRALDISGEFQQKSSIKEIPKEIGKLIHLRYLNLSHQEIKILPDIMCELHNLQTLNLTKCYKLEELPQGMEKFLNLRHLINDTTYLLSYMPIGIARLTRLRTLSEFVVSGSGGHNSKACSLEHLKDFNHLQGNLTIRGLGYVANLAETKRKQILKDKRNLCSLELRFDRDGEGEGINEDDELVLEALQPPLELKKLDIWYYKGNTFSSSWMTTLTRLRDLSLFCCQNCTHLSPLGKLWLLESLYIDSIDSMKKMGDEFWGIGIDDTSSSVILFPKLKFLTFSVMKNWEEWDYGIQTKGEEDDITFMPSLAFLSFNFCGKLKTLPEGLLQRTTLTKLEIIRSQVLEDRYKKETGNCWYNISHIPNIKIDREYVQGGPS